MAAIRKLATTYQDYLKANQYELVLGWMYDSEDSPEGSGPIFATIERQRIVDEGIEACYSDGDLIVYSGLGDEPATRFSGCVLDFRDGKFMLVVEGGTEPVLRQDYP